MDGRSSQSQNHSCFCRTLFDLGFDLSRDSFRDPVDPTVPDGGRALSSGGADYVRNRAHTRSAQVELGGMANRGHRRRLLVVRRERRGDDFGKIY